MKNGNDMGFPVSDVSIFWLLMLACITGPVVAVAIALVTGKY